MNILILNGSPHPNGTTAQLRAAFEAGALSLPNSNYIVEAENQAPLFLSSIAQNI